MSIDIGLHYILDEQGNPVPEPDLMKWSVWYQKADCSIGDDTLSDIRVSTVFLSLPHISKNSDEVMLYETMVFADEAVLTRLMELSETDDRSIISSVLGGVDIQKRYATKDEAVAGHKQMCEFVKVCLAKGLLTE